MTLLEKKILVAEADIRLKEFAKVNKIALDERIINVPVYLFDEYWSIHRPVGNYDYTPDEMMEDLGDSEGMLIPDQSGRKLAYVILMPERMEKYDRNYKVTIITHEKLHYLDFLMRYERKYDGRDESEIESEVEIMSLCIVRASEKPILEALKLPELYNQSSYFNSGIFEEIKNTLSKIGRKEFEKRLSCIL